MSREDKINQLKKALKDTKNERVKKAIQAKIKKLTDSDSIRK